MVELETDVYEYKIFVDDKNLDDMRRVAKEWVQYGYKQIKEIEHDKTLFLIYARKK